MPTSDSSAIDSGTSDSGLASECTSDADCNDGLACTGRETCVAGHCSSGTAVNCNDTVDCTHDTCDEPGGTCSHMRDDLLCTAPQTCDSVRGCVAACSESPCKAVSPQCVCGTGEGCYLQDGRHVCLPAGTVGVGETCDRVQCAPGTSCLRVGSSSRRICRQVCNVDADCVGGICIGTITGTTDMTCTEDCNIATQAGCVTGLACVTRVESSGSGRRYTTCSSAVGAGGDGDTCAGVGDCQRGFSCVTFSSGSRICHHWCELTSGAECGAGSTCVGFSSRVIIRGTEFGYCD